MELLNSPPVGLLVYCALAFGVLGFLARDELFWRGLMLIATCFYLTYYYFIADSPLWDAFIANSILAVVNISMICVVIVERSTLGMSRDKIDLFKMFPLLTPGQFRKLINAADWVEADETQTLVMRGEHPQSLFFPLHGPVEIAKGDQTTPIRPRIFIGEVAFLTGQPASATVQVKQGALYLRWDVANLRRLLHRHQGLNASLIANFNIDLAHKVARSQPLEVPEKELQSV